MNESGFLEGPGICNHDQSWLVHHIFCEELPLGREICSPPDWHTVDQHLIYMVKAQGHTNRGPGGRSWDPKGIEEMLAPRDSFYSFFLGRKDQSLSLYIYILADVPFVSLSSLRRFIMMRLLPWKCQHLCSVLAEVLKIKFLWGMQDLDTAPPSIFTRLQVTFFSYISWHYAIPGQEPEAQDPMT